MYGSGIYHMGELIDWGVKLNLLDKSGAWYSYNGDKIGQGKANSARFLEENQSIADEIESKIRGELLAVTVNELEDEPVKAGEIEDLDE